jgi:hypothetical protein
MPHLFILVPFSVRLLCQTIACGHRYPYADGKKTIAFLAPRRAAAAWCLWISVHVSHLLSVDMGLQRRSGPYSNYLTALGLLAASMPEDATASVIVTCRACQNITMEQRR